MDALERPRLEALACTLGGVVNGSVESLVSREAHRLVQSEQFHTLWTEANRAAHAVLLRVLTTGSGSDAITVDLGRAALRCAPSGRRTAVPNNNPPSVCPVPTRKA